MSISKPAPDTLIGHVAHLAECDARTLATDKGVIDRQAFDRRTKNWTLHLLHEFSKERIEATLARRDPPVVTLRALEEFRTVLQFLADAGQVEFIPTIRSLDEQMEKIKQAVTNELLRRFTSPGTAPPDCWAIHEHLTSVYGSDWRRELYREFERCRSQSH
jgi:hypothetical protein